MTNPRRPGFADLLALAGVIAILGGLWWIAPASALLVGGAACIAVAVLSARHERSSSRD